MQKSVPTDTAPPAALHVMHGTSVRRKRSFAESANETIRSREKAGDLQTSDTPHTCYDTERHKALALPKPSGHPPSFFTHTRPSPGQRGVRAPGDSPPIKRSAPRPYRHRRTLRSNPCHTSPPFRTAGYDAKTTSPTARPFIAGVGRASDALLLAVPGGQLVYGKADHADAHKRHTEHHTVHEPVHGPAVPGVEALRLGLLDLVDDLRHAVLVHKQPRKGRGRHGGVCKCRGVDASSYDPPVAAVAVRNIESGAERSGDEEMGTQKTCTASVTITEESKARTVVICREEDVMRERPVSQWFFLKTPLCHSWLRAAGSDCSGADRRSHLRVSRTRYVCRGAGSATQSASVGRFSGSSSAVAAPTNRPEMRRENLFEQLQRKRHVNKGASESTTRRKRHSPTRRAQARTRFNLDSGPQELLTHRGTPLDAWLDERAEELSGERSAEPDLLAEEFGVALESEDEGEEELGIDPVGVEYDLSRGEPHGKAPPPTFREAMQDIIAKSKARKEERRLERVRREQRVHELDEELDQVRDLLRPGRDDTGASGAEPVHVAPVSPFADYEQSILELSTEARGRPQDRAGKENGADVDGGQQRHAVASGDEDDVVASAESDTDTTNTSHEDDVVVSLGEWHSDPAMGRLLEHVDQMAGDVKRVPVLWTADVLWQVHELAGRCVPAAEAPSRVSRVRRRRPAASAPDDGGGDSERLDALESQGGRRSDSSAGAPARPGSVALSGGLVPGAGCAARPAGTRRSVAGSMDGSGVCRIARSGDAGGRGVAPTVVGGLVGCSRKAGSRLGVAHRAGVSRAGGVLGVAIGQVCCVPG
eukprot:ctg_1231.g307